MVKVRLHPPVASLSRKLGIYTYRVMRGKQTLMKTPDLSKVKWSEAQKTNRERFRQAIAYARTPRSVRTMRSSGAKQTGKPSVWRSPISVRGRIC